MTTINQKGGIFIGKSHAKGGIDFTITETGQRIEVEGDEPLIPKKGLNNQYIPEYLKTQLKEKITELENQQNPTTPTLKDLEDRLTIVKKMAAKKPELKARVKILEKMVSKAKKDPQLFNV